LNKKKAVSYSIIYYRSEVYYI